MGVRVTERAETIVVLLAGRIPQGEFNVLSVHFDIGHIVLEHSGDINLNNGASDGDTKTQTLRAVSTERAVYACPKSPPDQTRTYLRESPFREDDQQASLDSGAQSNSVSISLLTYYGTRPGLVRVETGGKR